MKMKRIPVEWVDRTRLRLNLPGEVVALYDGEEKLSKGSYTVSDMAGAIFLTSEPAGEITADVKDRTPEPERPGQVQLAGSDPKKTDAGA